MAVRNSRRGERYDYEWRSSEVESLPPADDDRMVPVAGREWPGPRLEASLPRIYRPPAKPGFWSFRGAGRRRPAPKSIVVSQKEWWHVKLCASRKSRREVLFARRKAGRGGHGSYRRSILSQYGC